MNAILNSLKAAARAAAARLKALWTRWRAKATVVAARVTQTARNIWCKHKEPILWSLAWIAFGTLATLGLAGVYYTSPQARLWLEETALAAGKLVATPFAWLGGRLPAPATDLTAAVAQTPPVTSPPATNRAIPIPGLPAKPAASAA